MSKKNNKIAVNQWEKVISSPEKETIDISKGDNKITVEISKNVSNQELAEFEASVIASCFDDDGYFIPYASRIGFDIQLVNYFTNIDCGKNLNKIESLIQTTNLIPAIYELVGVS